MSDQEISGTVANPSRLDEGWTCLRACVKSSDVMQRGESWVGVSGDGWALRKCAIDPGVVGKEKVCVRFGVTEGVGMELGAGECTGIEVDIGGVSMVMGTSWP